MCGCFSLCTCLCSAHLMCSVLDTFSQNLEIRFTRIGKLDSRYVYAINWSSAKCLFIWSSACFPWSSAYLRWGRWCRPTPDGLITSMCIALFFIFMHDFNKTIGGFSIREQDTMVSSTHRKQMVETNVIWAGFQIITFKHESAWYLSFLFLWR